MFSSPASAPGWKNRVSPPTSIRPTKNVITLKPITAVISNPLKPSAAYSRYRTDPPVSVPKPPAPSVLVKA